MKTYGIIGYPLTHSFSQQYFTEKFRQEGIADCRYDSFPIQSIHELEKIIKDNPSLQGLNITIPHKQSVLSHLDDVSNLPPGLRACNCIRINDGKLTGYNTDMTGFERSLVPYLKPIHTNALILGSGGAAEAVAFVLKKLNIIFQTVSRKMHNGATIQYADIDESIMKEHLLIINTTPLGTFPDTATCPAIPYQYLTQQHLLFDLVYNPAKTLFLQKGEEQGATIINGYEMLVIQAEESWRIWNEV